MIKDRFYRLVVQVEEVEEHHNGDRYTKEIARRRVLDVGPASHATLNKFNRVIASLRSQHDPLEQQS